MGVSGGPDVVDSGLVLALDAANPKSYSGTGTTWFDLGPNKNNATISNFTYNSQGYFDTTNSAASLQLASAITINPYCTFVVFMQYLVGDQVSAWNYFLRTSFNANVLELGTFANSSTFTIKDNNPPTMSTFVTRVNTLSMFSFGMGLESGTNKLFVSTNDGVKSYSTTVSANTSFNIQTLFTGTGGGNFHSNVYSLFLYNRELSSDEILQNFNATRSRFGL